MSEADNVVLILTYKGKKYEKGGYFKDDATLDLMLKTLTSNCKQTIREIEDGRTKTKS